MHFTQVTTERERERERERESERERERNWGGWVGKSGGVNECARERRGSGAGGERGETKGGGGGEQTDRQAETETEIRTMHAQYVLSVGIYRYMFVALPVAHGPNQ